MAINVNDSLWLFKAWDKNGRLVAEDWRTLKKAKSGREAHEREGHKVSVRFMREDGSLSPGNQADKDFYS